MFSKRAGVCNPSDGALDDIMKEIVYISGCHQSLCLGRENYKGKEGVESLGEAF